MAARVIKRENQFSRVPPPWSDRKIKGAFPPSTSSLDYECHGLGHDDYLVANLGSIENARELQFSVHSSSSKNQRSDVRLRPPWRLHNATPRNSPMTLALPLRTFWRLLTMLAERERHNHLGALQNKKIELKNLCKESRDFKPI